MAQVHGYENMFYDLIVDADKASMGGVGTSDEQNGTQAAGEGLSMAGDGDQGEEEQRKSMPK